MFETVSVSVRRRALRRVRPLAGVAGLPRPHPDGVLHGVRKGRNRVRRARRRRPPVRPNPTPRCPTSTRRRSRSRSTARPTTPASDPSRAETDTFDTFAISVVNDEAAAISVAQPLSEYALNTWAVSGDRPDTVVLSVPRRNRRRRARRARTGRRRRVLVMPASAVIADGQRRPGRADVRDRQRLVRRRAGGLVRPLARVAGAGGLLRPRAARVLRAVLKARDRGGGRRRARLPAPRPQTSWPDFHCTS